MRCAPTRGAGRVADLSPRQRAAVVRAVDGLEHVLLWEGAVRSGKTLSSILAWLEYVRTAPPGPLLMVGKTKDTLRRNVLDEIDTLFPPGRSPLVHTAGANEGRLFGRKVHMVGANDAKAESRIRGLTLAGSYVDEATLLPSESYWSMLLTRHITTPGAKIFATTNPDSPAHWLKRTVIDDADAVHAAIFSFTLDDNPVIGPDERARLEASLRGLFYKRFIQGLWVAAEGAIYDMLDLDGVNRTTFDTMGTLTGRYWLGVDYGDSNPFHAVLIAETIDARLVVVGEWRWASREKQRQMLQTEYEEALGQWLEHGAGITIGGQSLVGTWPLRTAVDPSAAGFRVLLRRRGWVGLTEPDEKINAVRDGLRDVSALLGTRRLLFARGAAPELERELLGYVWDEKASAKGEDRPVKVDDHGPDALRYAVAAARQVWRPWLTTLVDEDEVA